MSQNHYDGTVNTNQVVYTRAQKGHSLVLHILFGGIVLWIPTIYFAVSKNHYFHI